MSDYISGAVEHPFIALGMISALAAGVGIVAGLVRDYRLEHRSEDAQIISLLDRQPS